LATMRQSETDSDEKKVLAANEAFYRALEALDQEKMEALWWHEDWVQCLHPGWPLIRGWEQIRASWENIFRSTTQMTVSTDQLFLHILGEAAWVSCIEQVTISLEGDFVTSRVQTTNIFTRRKGEWKMVHHHTTPIPGSGMLDASHSVQ